jgi:hypothetical protein
MQVCVPEFWGIKEESVADGAIHIINTVHWIYPAQNG